MFTYIIKRIFSMIPVILGVILLIFLIMQMAPGNPAQLILGDNAPAEAVEELTEELGLNDPILFRYVKYVYDLTRGDMGYSYITRRSVASEVSARIPATLKLMIVATIVSIIVAIPLGIFAAVKQNTIFDNVSMVISLLGISMPTFWLALMLVLLFSLKLGWFPVQGIDAGWKSYVLPATAIGFVNMAAIARTIRSSMLETIRQDYIRTAKSKGLSDRRVIIKHAFKNALIPTITVIGVQFGALMGGAILTETVFAWPGLGRLVVQSVNNRDTPMVLGCVVAFSVGFSIINLITDLIYGFVDPRIKSLYK